MKNAMPNLSTIDPHIGRAKCWRLPVHSLQITGQITPAAAVFTINTALQGGETSYTVDFTPLPNGERRAVNFDKGGNVLAIANV